MHTLHEVQRGFLAAILDGDESSLVDVVLGDELSASERIRIYRNNTFTSLGAALAAIYPVMERLAGAECFAALARDYVRDHPSCSGNLHDFGVAFAHFIDGRAGMDALPYAADVAHLEWAWHRAFHAATDAPFPFRALAAVPAREHGLLRFRLNCSVTVLDSPYPFATIWRANQVAPGDEAVVDLGAGRERVLVGRIEGEVRVRTLDPGEHALLSAFAAGEALADAMNAALDAEPGLDVPACLSTHVAHGTLTGFTH